MKYYTFLFYLLIQIFSANVMSLAQGKTTITIAATGSQERTNWSIAGTLNGTNPNILSEVAWKNLISYGYTARINIPVKKRISLFLDLKQQFIVSGRVTDADYGKDNRQEYVFLANEDAGKGRINNVSAGLSFLAVQSAVMRLYVGGGYGLLNQQLFLFNEQKGLNSKYTNYWFGPLVRVDAKFQLNDFIGIDVGVRYHQIAYRAAADWNLIEEFEHPKSFTHKANGFGVENNMHMRFNIDEKLTLFTSLQYNHWSTGKGIDELYKKDQIIVKTRLNGVERINLGFDVGFVLHLR